MLFATKRNLTAAAVLLAMSGAWAQGANDASIVDSLKTKASDSLPKQIVDKGADASAAAPPPVQTSKANSPAQPKTVVQKVATLDTKAVFPETKPSSSEGGYPVRTVQELLDIEAKLALLKSKDRFETLKAEKAPKPSASDLKPVRTGPPPEMIDLLAVYGHGNTRFVNISYNGARMTRIASGARVGPYTLSSINGTCVMLTKDTAAEPVKKGNKRGKVENITTEKNVCITESVASPYVSTPYVPSAVRMKNSLPPLNPAMSAPPPFGSNR